MLNNCISLIFSAIATKFRLIVGYVISLFNKLSLCHIWSGSLQYLSSVHDRYPVIYVDDHIWRCSADLLSRLVRAAILKSEGVLAVFSINLKTPSKKFSKI